MAAAYCILFAQGLLVEMNTHCLARAAEIYRALPLLSLAHLQLKVSCCTPSAMVMTVDLPLYKYHVKSSYF